jgi:hypothetical protein
MLAFGEKERRSGPGRTRPPVPGVAVTTWTYDAYRGWLTAKKYEGRTTRVVVGYLYDDGGNRKQSLEGGDANGAESQTTTCTANVLNQ